MKLIIVCSHPLDPRQRPGPFEKQFDSAWADRFLQHLRNQRDLCTGCGDRCVHCRDWRVEDHAAEIAAVIRHPSVLPELIDDPLEYLPEELPRHDVLIAVQIHEEILVELPRLSAHCGGKAVIAPVEAPDWMSRWAKNKLISTAKEHHIEVAVPKPFCALTAPEGSAIAAFIERFRIGKPRVEIEILDGRIARATALISAPCGNSHYVAHNLQGCPINDALAVEVSHYWHAFPCTAGMKHDPELGDTILHRGGQIHMEAFCRAAGIKYRP